MLIGFFLAMMRIRAAGTSPARISDTTKTFDSTKISWDQANGTANP